MNRVFVVMKVKILFAATFSIKVNAESLDDNFEMEQLCRATIN